ncbi:MAG: hypothetical protein Q4A82_05575 [Corynebacterium sp.]|nr:hypothetical protein [Corynebacterium sp.]
MKLFSRKALISVATAAAVTTGAMTAATPAMAQSTSASASTSAASPTTSEEDDSFSGQLKGMSRDDNGKLSAKKIGEWIAIIGTIITVMTSVITFMGKMPNFGR